MDKYNENTEVILPYPKWVKAAMLKSINGYTVEAVRAKIKNGIWRERLHWKKAPDGNIMVNPRAIDDWNETDGQY